MWDFIYTFLLLSFLSTSLLFVLFEQWYAIKNSKLSEELALKCLQVCLK